MSINLISDSKFTTLAATILSPTKSYYSPFPEFTPLEFEHFCVKLLAILEYQIINSNDNIAPDGGVDFIAKKENRIIIGQCKKSDWSGKIVGGSASNIGEPTVMQHFGLVNMKQSDYPDNELVGYVMTLRKFSLPCRTSFENHPKIKLIGLIELRELITKALITIDSSNKQISIRPESSTNPWYDVELGTINDEIKLLENLIAQLELEYSQIKTRSMQVEKVIMNELIDLYREIALLKSEIQFIKTKKDKLSELKDSKNESLDQEYENLKEQLDQEYISRQENINQGYEEIENEYLEDLPQPLNQIEFEEAKILYRELSHLYHPDKHQESKIAFTKIFKAINKAKTNIEALKDIRKNPHKYFEGDIPKFVDVSKKQLVSYLKDLQKQYNLVQTRIETILDDDNSNLYDMYYTEREKFTRIVNEMREKLESELKQLQNEICLLNQDNIKN